MQSYRLPFLAVIALWLLPIQAIAAERPVLGQETSRVAYGSKVVRLTVLARPAEQPGFLASFLRLTNTGCSRRGPTCLREKTLTN
jgi:hypothetical protein